MNNLVPFDPERANLNFKGATVSDDITNSCTTIDLTTLTRVRDRIWAAYSLGPNDEINTDATRNEIVRR